MISIFLSRRVFLRYSVELWLHIKVLKFDELSVDRATSWSVALNTSFVCLTCVLWNEGENYCYAEVVIDSKGDEARLEMAAKPIDLDRSETGSSSKQI